MTQISRLMFGLLALLIAGSAAAQTNYPEKPIRLVVSFPPGSGPDTTARLLGQKFAEALGKPVLIAITLLASPAISQPSASRGQRQMATRWDSWAKGSSPSIPACTR